MKDTLLGKNPFTPLFGQVPACIAGRGQFLAEMAAAFDGPMNNPNLSSLIIGPRGTGKTVLLSHIAQLAEERGWIVARVSACNGMLEDVIQRARESGSHLLEKPSSRRLAGVELSGVMGFSWESEAPAENWRTQMNKLFAQLAECDAGLLITVDEINAACDDLITLATAYQHFLSEGKHVSLVMAGLPGNVSGLLNGRSTSFWRRARQQNIGRIADEDVRMAFCETLALAGATAQEDALDLAVSQVAGFAYMLQLLGYWSFESMNARGAAHLRKDDVLQGLDTARNDMITGVLSSTYSELSAGDIRFLEAMLESAGPSTMCDIAERMGKSQAYASQYRLRLIAQGVIGPRGRGRVDFEIPFFREYLQECVGWGSWPDALEPSKLFGEGLDDARAFAQEVGKALVGQ